MNSDTFCLSRFRHLAVKDLLDNKKKYLLSAATLICVPAIITISNLFLNQHYTFYDEVVVFTMILFVCGSIWASVSFSDLGKASGCIEMMMTPASMLEKYILRWIIAIPLFLFFFVISALVADWLRVELIPDSTPGHFVDVFLYKENHYRLSASKYNFFHLCIVSMFFLVQSLFFLGSTLWKKLSAVKTFLALLILYAIYFGSGVLIMKIFMPTGTYSVHNFTDSAIVFVIIPLFVLFIYYIAYVRFKESEIINRW